MIKENTMNDKGVIEFHFPIPMSIINSHNPVVKRVAQEFTKFIQNTTSCDRLGKRRSPSASDLLANTNPKEYIMNEVTRLKNSAQVLSMMTLMITEMMKIQKWIVNLNTLLCISVSNGERLLFNVLFSQYIYFSIGNVFVMYILMKRPFVFFTMIFTQQVICILVYQKMIRTAKRMKSKFWTFKILEEWKHRQRQPLLKRYKSHRKKRHRNKFVKK